MSNLQVDDNLIAKAWETKFQAAVQEAVLLQAAATQLQRENLDLANQVQELTETNERLMAESGRLDGVPADGESEDAPRE